MNLGSIVYADRRSLVLTPRGEPARVIEVTTRQREGEAQARAVLVRWTDGHTGWIKVPQPPTLRVQGPGQPA